MNKIIIASLAATSIILTGCGTISGTKIGKADDTIIKQNNQMIDILEEMRNDIREQRRITQLDEIRKQQIMQRMQQEAQARQEAFVEMMQKTKQETNKDEPKDVVKSKKIKKQEDKSNNENKEKKSSNVKPEPQEENKSNEDVAESKKKMKGPADNWKPSANSYKYKWQPSAKE